MLAEERRRKILEILEEKGVVKTSNLSDKFSVTDITVRKDLDKLAKRGELERTHGGAISTDESTAFEPSHDQKAMVNMEEKKAIGRKAATLIKENTTIFLSTGTTSMQLIPHLKDKEDLDLLTNSLNCGYELSKVPDLDFSIIGGDFRRKSFALVGPIAQESFKYIYVDQLFLGVNGISKKYGITTPTMAEAKVCRSMIDVSKEIIVVADHSKFGEVVHGKISDIDVIDTIVTDSKVKEKYKKDFVNSDINWLEAEIKS